MRQAIIFIFSVLTPLFTIGQWDMVHCGPGFYNLDFVNDSTGYVLALDTANGDQHILKTINYGIDWDTTYSTGGALLLMDLSFPTEEIGYVSGGGMGYILKTIDGGETWIEQELNEVWEIQTIEFQNELDGYGGSTDGYNSFVETHDGGETWEYNLEMGIKDVSIFENCNVRMVSGNGYYTNQDCQPWSVISANFGPGTFSSIEMTSAMTIFIGGLGWEGEITFNYGILGRSLDNGESFEFIEYPFVGTIRDIQFVDFNIGYAVTQCPVNNPYVDYQTIFLKTTDGGDSWNYQEFVNEGTCQIINANHISCVSDQICYATGSGGIFRTMNGGGDMQPMPVGIEEIEDDRIVKVFPNPTSGDIIIDSHNSIKGVTMFNTLGQKIISIEGGNSKSLQLDISEFIDGMYILSIETFGGSMTKTIIKN